MGLGPDRLGAVQGDAPTRKIERSPFVGRDLVQAEVIGKIRRGAEAAPEIRDGLQPSRRPLHEMEWRENDAARSQIN